MWFPVDLPTPADYFVLRTQTQQSHTPITKGLLLPLAWRTTETKSSLSGTQNNTPVSQTTYAKTTRRNVGLSVSPAAGVWFSGLFNEEVALTKNVPDAGMYRVSGAWEEFIIREALVRVGFDVSLSCTLGIALRGQSVKGDVLGSFSMQPDERTNYTGQRLGLAASTLLSFPPFKVALRYEAPVSGKVSIAGESKVSSAPGFLGGAVNFLANNSFSLRGEYGLFEFSKNELGVPVKGPSSTRQVNILPLGLAVDARALPLSVYGLGLRSDLGPSLRFETDAVLGRVYYAADNDMVPPSSIDDAEKAKMYSLRAGLSLEKTDWEAQVFIDYGTMKFSRNVNQSDLTHAMSQWGVGLRAGIEI